MTPRSATSSATGFATGRTGRPRSESRKAISIDLFIADPDRIGRGLGRQMLRRYVETVAFPAYPDERLCWIGHQLENGAAIACSKASGFTAVREYVEEGKDFVLLVRER